MRLNNRPCCTYPGLRASRSRTASATAAPSTSNARNLAASTLPPGAKLRLPRIRFAPGTRRRAGYASRRMRLAVVRTLFNNAGCGCESDCCAGDGENCDGERELQSSESAPSGSGGSMCDIGPHMSCDATGSTSFGIAATARHTVGTHRDAKALRVKEFCRWA
jgi:hypothetical protein